MTDIEHTLTSKCVIDIQDRGFYVLSAEGRTGETWAIVTRSLDDVGYVVQAATTGDMTLNDWEPESNRSPYAVGYIGGYGDSIESLIVEFRQHERDWTRFLRGELYDEDGEWIPDPGGAL